MEVYGNQLPSGRKASAQRAARRMAAKYAQELKSPIGIAAGAAKADPPLLGIHPLVPAEGGVSRQWTPKDPGLVLGTIRMGFGHYRMALAIASAANARGLVPYWLDLLRFKDSAAAGIIRELEGLYRIGSRLSQKYPLFNNLIWERITEEEARPLSNTVRDMALAEIFSQIPAGLDPSLPYVATHPWTARAAVAAGMRKVVTIVPDNMPIAFNLAPGAVHAVQTPSAFLGYRSLRHMGDRVFIGPEGFMVRKILKPMPEGSIFYSGHYVDHELVDGLEEDCGLRLERLSQGSPRRFLLTVGGAGAQLSKYLKILKHLKEGLLQKRVAAFVNLGDHYDRLPELLLALKKMDLPAEVIDNDWSGFQDFVASIRSKDLGGLYLIIHRATFPAVYSTNLLIRESDVLITKPSELSFYPIPKLFIQRVGRHEAWGAIHSAEIGDGTPETIRMPMVLQLLDMLREDKDLFRLYLDRTIANKAAGVYDGAYRVVDQVLGM